MAAMIWPARADVAGHQPSPPAALASTAQQHRRRPVELVDPVLAPVELEPQAIAAEGVGQDVWEPASR